MRIETTKDILDHSRKFHKIIAEYYNKISEASDKERVKLLLNYLKERENQIEKTISELESSLSNGVLNSWFSYSQCKTNLDELTKLIKKDKTTIEEVIDMFVQIDNCLIDLYTKLCNSTKNSEVQDFFNNLIKLEEIHKIKSLKNVSQFEDF
jgi:hypothetical protein